MNYYTGVGSRDTPEDVCLVMAGAARRVAKEGWVLRSGHADRADMAFETGARDVRGACEIFVPWWGFNGAYKKSNKYILPEGELLVQAMEVASRIHPKWADLPKSHRLLHARNVFQVFGPNLDRPSECLVCWTEDGQAVGGTRTAIVLAREANVPILNLGRSVALFGRAPSKMNAGDVARWILKHAVA